MITKSRPIKPAKRSQVEQPDPDLPVDDFELIDEDEMRDELLEELEFAENDGDHARSEKERSLERDDPDSLLDEVDPVPPE